MSVYELLLIGTIVIALGAIGTYVMVKRAIKKLFSQDLSMMAYEIASDMLDNAMKDEETLKKIQAIGIVFGNGLKQGIGLDQIMGKKGSKFKIADLVPMVLAQVMGGGGGGLGSLLGGIVGGGGEQQPQTQAPQQQKEQPSNLIGVLR